MKANKEETTWLLDLAGNGSVKNFFPSSNKDESPDRKPLIKYVKGEGRCRLDGGNGIGHVKQRGKSWGMENLKENLHHIISS